LVLVEIQQNSDSTLRVYDWGRCPGGKPRALHVRQALAAIRFGALLRDKVRARRLSGAPFLRERLVRCPHFAVERWRMRRRAAIKGAGEMAIFSVVDGAGEVLGQGFARRLRVGDTMLMPACVRAWEFVPNPAMTLLRTTLP
jgi:mannose-6-phosphate isomerase